MTFTNRCQQTATVRWLNDAVSVTSIFCFHARTPPTTSTTTFHQSANRSATWSLSRYDCSSTSYRVPRKKLRHSFVWLTVRKPKIQILIVHKVCTMNVSDNIPLGCSNLSQIMKNKNVSKANKSRTLLRYSITYHYDLIFYQLAMQTKRIAVYVANITQLPYLNVRGICISVDSTPGGWFLFKIRMYVRNNVLLDPLLVLVGSSAMRFTLFECYPV